MAKINLEQLTIRIEGELKKVANVLKKVELKEYSFTYNDENGQTQTKKSTLLENIKYLVEQLLALKKVAEGKQDELTVSQLAVINALPFTQVEKDALIASIETKANKSIKVKKANGVDTTLGQLTENDELTDITYVDGALNALALVVEAMVETVNQLEASQNIYDITSQAPTVNTNDDRKWEVPFTQIGLKENATQAEITAFANRLSSNQIGFVKGYIEATLTGTGQVDISTEELKIFPDLASAVFGTTNLQVRQNGSTISLKERVYVDVANAKLIVEVQPASGQSWQTTNPLLKQLRFNKATSSVDTSSFAKFDLSNVDNAVLKAKGVLAGLVSQEQVNAKFTNNADKLVANQAGTADIDAILGNAFLGNIYIGGTHENDQHSGNTININKDAGIVIGVDNGAIGLLSNGDETGEQSGIGYGRTNPQFAKFGAIVGVANALTGSTITFEDGTTLVL